MKGMSNSSLRLVLPGLKIQGCSLSFLDLRQRMSQTVPKRNQLVDYTRRRRQRAQRLSCWSGYALQDCEDPGSLATTAPPTLGHARLYPGAPTAKKWLAETYAVILRRIEVTKASAGVICQALLLLIDSGWKILSVCFMTFSPAVAGA